MPKRLQIPIEVVVRSGYNIHVCRTIINTILKSRKSKVSQAHIFDVKLPALGRIKSHGNKVHKHRKNTLKRDQKRKKKAYLEKQFNKENLLW